MENIKLKQYIRKSILEIFNSKGYKVNSGSFKFKDSEGEEHVCQINFSDYEASTNNDLRKIAKKLSAVDINFSIDGETLLTGNFLNDKGIVLKIFSTIIDYIKNNIPYLKKFNVIYFSAKANEQSRKNLYDILAKKFSSLLNGYTYIDKSIELYNNKWYIFVDNKNLANYIGDDINKFYKNTNGELLY